MSRGMSDQEVAHSQSLRSHWQANGARGQEVDGIQLTMAFLTSPETKPSVSKLLSLAWRSWLSLTKLARRSSPGAEPRSKCAQPVRDPPAFANLATESNPKL